MALPCFCYKCVKCISLESLKDPYCLSVEKENCKERFCYNCDITCENFTDKSDVKRNIRSLLMMDM